MDEGRVRRFSLACILTVFLVSACGIHPSTPIVTIPTQTEFATETAQPAPTSTPNPTATPTATETAQSNLPIYVDFLHPEKSSTIDFGFLTSQAFVDKVLEMEKEGLWPDFPNKGTMIPFTGINFDLNPNTGLMRDSGFDLLFTPKQGITAYADPATRPYELVSIYKTEPIAQFNNQRLYVDLLRFHNKDIGYFEGAISFDSDDHRSFAPDSVYFPNGNYYIETGDKDKPYGCHANQASRAGLSENFCTWYFANTKFTQAPEIFNNWKATGNLSNVVTNPDGSSTKVIPLIPSGGQAFP